MYMYVCAYTRACIGFLPILRKGWSPLRMYICAYIYIYICQYVYMCLTPPFPKRRRNPMHALA